MLTWDARGFYESGGTVMIDHRDFEGRDVRELIDFVAAQPEALLDAAGDPRVGMNGPSTSRISRRREARTDAARPRAIRPVRPGRLAPPCRARRRALRCRS